MTDIEYHPKTRHNDAFVSMDVASIYRNEEKSETVRWTSNMLVGTKVYVSQILEQRGCFLETPEAFAKWETQLETYQQLKTQIGVQFTATGFGYAERQRSSWWSYTAAVSMTRDGVPLRVVLDEEGDPNDEKSKQETASTAYVNNFWGEKPREEDREILDGEDGAVYLRPTHPYLQVFCFEKDCYVEIHAGNLERYEYAQDLEKKLILPADTKELVTVLIEGAAHKMEDIITGKVGGVIVICTGYPGTGKTLTAEVYSEQIRRPLYVVQCAQLGTDEEELEGELKLVLSRTTRWGAILLIDEADVYVRARENDLQQNAIVGVFLRVLERFQGVLFMTSNRATAIDDAIMSRAIAHIKYDLPDHEQLKLIWEVLAENYKVDLYPKDFEMLATEFPGISGRNVKTLLKLATAVARKEQYKRDEVIALVRKVAKFVDFPAHEKRAKK